jgi:hypothetical protein
MNLPPPPPVPNFVKYAFLIMLGGFIVALFEIVGNSIAEHHSLAQEPCIEAPPIQADQESCFKPLPPNFVQAPDITTPPFKPVGNANTVIYIFIATNTSQISLNLHLKDQP